MKRILLVMFFLLYGCSTVPTSAPLIAEPTKSIYIDSALLRPCIALETPPEILTFEGILTVTKTNTLAYVDCRNRMDAAIIVLKKFSNLNP